MPNLPSKALSVRQPWAWLIVNGHKDFENRTTGAMKSIPAGRHAIHASKTLTQSDYEEAREFALNLGVTVPAPSDLTYGAIIGAATLKTKCKNKAFSHWSFGPGITLEQPETCEPIPCKGSLGSFYWRRSGLVGDIKPWMEKWTA